MGRHGERGREGNKRGKVRDANLKAAVGTDHLFSLNDPLWYSSSWWSLLLIVDWEGNLCLTTLWEEGEEEEGEDDGEEEGKEEGKEGEERRGGGGGGGRGRRERGGRKGGGRGGWRGGGR